jgi:hypothetical protein
MCCNMPISSRRSPSGKRDVGSTDLLHSDAAASADSRLAAWSEADDVGRQRLRVLEVRPVRLAPQLKLKLQDVAQRQAANGVCDQRLTCENRGKRPRTATFAVVKSCLYHGFYHGNAWTTAY